MCEWVRSKPKILVETRLQCWDFYKIRGSGSVGRQRNLLTGLHPRDWGWIDICGSHPQQERLEYRETAAKGKEEDQLGVAVRKKKTVRVFFWRLKLFKRKNPASNQGLNQEKDKEKQLIQDSGRIVYPSRWTFNFNIPNNVDSIGWHNVQLEKNFQDNCPPNSKRA